ncbi:MAG: hypothetical protein AAFR61_13820 [Bacteroidota bacterium]
MIKLLLSLLLAFYGTVGQWISPVSSAEKPTMMVLPCANGYDYSTAGLDLEAELEKALLGESDFVLKSVPYKILMGVNYLGVFDKKYCPPILEKVPVDVLIMCRFAGKNDPFGYEVRLLRTRDMRQVDSIQATGLQTQEEVRKSVREQKAALMADIRALIE